MVRPMNVFKQGDYTVGKVGGEANLVKSNLSTIKNFTDDVEQ